MLDLDCELGICCSCISVLKLTQVKALSSGNFSTTVSKRAFLYLNENEKYWPVFVLGKIYFVRLCELLTMNYELLIAMSDRINHLKNWPVQLENKSECIWMVIKPSW